MPVELIPGHDRHGERHVLLAGLAQDDVARLAAASPLSVAETDVLVRLRDDVSLSRLGCGTARARQRLAASETGGAPPGSHGSPFWRGSLQATNRRRFTRATTRIPEERGFTKAVGPIESAAGRSSGSRWRGASADTEGSRASDSDWTCAARRQV